MGRSRYDIHTGSERGLETPQICGQAVKILQTEILEEGSKIRKKSCRCHMWTVVVIVPPTVKSRCCGVKLRSGRSHKPPTPILQMGWVDRWHETWPCHQFSRLLISDCDL